MEKRDPAPSLVCIPAEEMKKITGRLRWAHSKQKTNLLAACHVKGTSLKTSVAQDQTDLSCRSVIREISNTCNYSTGSDSTVKSLLNGLAKAREIYRICGNLFRVKLFEVCEILVKYLLRFNVILLGVVGLFLFMFALRVV